MKIRRHSLRRHPPDHGRQPRNPAGLHCYSYSYSYSHSNNFCWLAVLLAIRVSVSFPQSHAFLLRSPTTVAKQRSNFPNLVAAESPLSWSTSTLLSLPETTADLPELAFQPLPLHTFAGKIEQRLKDEFGQENIERVLQCWRMLDADYEYKRSVRHLLEGDDEDDDGESGNERSRESVSFRTQKCHSFVPGLTVKEFWETRDFDWATCLQSKYATIKREFSHAMANPEALATKGNNIWSGALTEDASSYGVGWRTLVLMDRGVWDPTNAALFPDTAKAIRDCQIPAVEVFFASMQPHSKIQPHSDFTNFVLTTHLALEIPYSGQNKCRLRIGDTIREWINGQVTVFETSIMHDAENDSDLTRYILMLRVWHPDLTAVERQALQFIWDALDIPGLTSSFPQEREQARVLAATQRAFPTLAPTRENTSGSFGGGGGGGGAKRGFGGDSTLTQKKKKTNKKHTN